MKRFNRSWPAGLKFWHDHQFAGTLKFAKTERDNWSENTHGKTLSYWVAWERNLRQEAARRGLL